MPKDLPPSPCRIHVPLLALMGAFLLLTGCSETKPRVVLYSAQDPEFAEEVLPDFTRRTGLQVSTKYDTEANKSVSLYAELIQEKNRPRCDVHWNNEVLATIRLARQGLLEPYQSPSAEGYPPWTKAKDHTWQAFAARARVLLVNTKMVPDVEKRPRSLLDLTDAALERASGDGETAVWHDSDAGSLSFRGARAGQGKGVLPGAEEE